MGIGHPPNACIEACRALRREQIARASLPEIASDVNLQPRAGGCRHLARHTARGADPGVPAVGAVRPRNAVRWVGGGGSLGRSAARRRLLVRCLAPAPVVHSFRNTGELPHPVHDPAILLQLTSPVPLAHRNSSAPLRRRSRCSFARSRPPSPPCAPRKMTCCCLCISLTWPC